MFDVQRSMFDVSLFQACQNFRVAHIHPAALNFQASQPISRGDHCADGVGQFVFAVRRLLQPRREVEQRRSENINARVIPDRGVGLEPAVTAQLFQLLRRRLFHEPFQAKLFVEKVQSALRHVLAARDGDDAREIAFTETTNHLRIGCGWNENIAISQQKRRVADEFLRRFRCLARAVLDGLTAKGDARVPFLAVAKMIFDDLSAPAGDDENLADTRRQNSVNDVLEDGFALDAEHGLGQLVGEFPHARALAGGQNHGFHE